MGKDVEMVVLVLADDDFSTLVGAVEEGRRELENIRKFVGYLLGSNVGEVVALLLGLLVGGPLLLLPAQILWVNVVTDALTAIALGLEPAERDLMRRPPHARNRPLLDRFDIVRVLLGGCWIGLGTWWLFDRHDGSLAEARTIAFTALVVLEQVNLLAWRTLRVPVSQVGWWSNPWLLVALLGGTIAAAVAWFGGFRGLSPVSGMYARVLKAGNWLGVPPAASLTPQEFAERVGRVAPSAQGPVRTVSEIYTQELYGRTRPDANQLERARSAWRELRGITLGGLFRRNRGR